MEKALSFVQYVHNELEGQPTPVLIAIGVATLVAALKINAYFKHQQFVRTFGEADYRFNFGLISIPGLILGPGLDIAWLKKDTLYKRAKKEVITIEPTLWGEPILYSNSVEVMRQIAGSGTYNAWHKPRWSVMATLYWGNNLLAVNDVEWRKHRKIVQPAFNPAIYERVWQETTRLFNEMVQVDKWPTLSGQSVSFPDIHPMTQKLALYTILSCGFGVPLEWGQGAEGTNATIGLREGIEAQGNHLIFLSIVPNWFLNLPIQRLKYIKEAVNGLRDWFYQRVKEKKAEIEKTLNEANGDVEMANLKKDVFSLITWASQGGGKSLLQDSEIIGNSWVMIFAGHETTAASIAATLCFLAAYEEEQAVVHEEIDNLVRDTVQDQDDLPFEGYNSLIKTKSAFLEALRLFPAGDILMREAREDTILRVPVSDGQGGGAKGEKEMIVPKGTVVIADMVGIQRNPRHYPEPERFRPSRWYNTEFDDAFTQFSVGPRKCIGQKFALTESVCFLTNILRHYKVSPLLSDGEGLEEWRKRVLCNIQRRMTLSIKETPVIFQRR